MVATYDQVSTSACEDEQTQTQTEHTRSAMFTVWNLIADLIETQDQKPNEQQQISDFYAKAGSTFSRVACLMQLYFNALSILEKVKDVVIFAEGDNQDLVINEIFVRRVESIIRKEYYMYDNTYLPRAAGDQVTTDPMIIVEKETVIAAWRWYDHYLNIATTLFTIDHDYSCKPTITSSLIPSKPKTLKQLIMLFDFNIFPLSAISVKNPTTGQTYVYHYLHTEILFFIMQFSFRSGIIKNRPALGETALQELLKDSLLKFNYFLTDVRGRNVKSYMKVPIPSIDNPTRELILNNLLKHDINIDEYNRNYEKSSIPTNNSLSKLSLEIFEYSSCFVSQYSKYKNQLNLVIQKHLENHSIEETDDGDFIIKNQNMFAREFDAIENLVSSEKQEEINSKSRLPNFTNETASKKIAESAIQLKNITTTELNIFCDLSETNQDAQRNDLTQTSIDLQLLDTACNSFLFFWHAFIFVFIKLFSETSMLKDHDLSENIHNSSGVTLAKNDKRDQLIIIDNANQTTITDNVDDPIDVLAQANIDESMRSCSLSPNIFHIHFYSNKC